MTLIVFSPLIQPGTCHAFPQPAFPDKNFLELPYLLIQQEIRLMNKADNGVGSDFSSFLLDIRPICLI